MNAVDPAITSLIAYAMATIFAASAAMKLRDVELFESSVANYQIVARWLEKPLAYAIPIAEASCAAALIFPRTRTGAASALILILAMFTGAIAINLARGRTNIDCGCFGPALRQQLSGWLVARNDLMMALIAIATIHPASRTMTWLDLTTIALGAATMVVLYASANIALANAATSRALEMI